MIKFTIKFILILIIILIGCVVCLFFPLIKKSIRKKSISLWSKSLLKVLSVNVHANFNFSNDEKFFFVCNHISWIDILVINSLHPSVFIAKNSVRKWPIIGLMSKLAGTIFLSRTSKRSLQDSFVKIKKSIEYSSILVFPESYASIGRSVSRFHSNFFQVPIDLKIAVTPLSIQYLKNNKFTDAPAYVGRDNLIYSLYKVIKEDGFDVYVQFSKKLLPHEMNRKQLAAKAEELIKSHLNQG